MLDLGYPNDGAIKTIGALKPHDQSGNHPDGWTQSVIDKIHQDIVSNTPSNPNRSVNMDSILSHYSQEERDAWKWYQDEVLPPDKWKTLVQNYEANGGPKNAVDKPPGFDDDKDYVPKPGSKFKPPDGVKTWSGADNTSGDLAVSHDAINFFIKSVASVASDGHGILLDARTTLGDIDPRPGGFARAEVMRQRVRGASADDPGLQGDTMALLAAVHSALFDLQANLKTLMNNYKEAEDFNTLTSDKLDQVMDDSWGKIDNLDDYGQTKSTGGGGPSGTGSGTGDKKNDS
jgi:hypothetical protein